MRVLLLSHSFNSLTQRLFVELREAGHEVSIELDVKDSVTVEAIELFRPDVVVAPFLKRRIPDAVFRRVPCLVVHPGPPGDGGPSALDWAILEGKQEWGVTVLRATGDLDQGPVLASATFPMRAAAKSSLYRNEVTEAAVAAVFRALDGVGGVTPPVAVTWKPACKQADRAISWSTDDTETVLRKIRSADGMPGVLDSLDGHAVRLFDASPSTLRGNPGSLLGRAGTALCRATTDGAVFIGNLKWEKPDAVKLPATVALGAAATALPEVEGPHEIDYREDGLVGWLSFTFYNGAMSTPQCRALLEAVRAAKARPTKVLVLTGGRDFWSNGIHLNTIESAASPADESWRNIEAMDDLTEELVRLDGKRVVAAMRGNAGAGGVFLGLAADLVWARDGVILNPHYKGMGNLYGSEYWTYLLPRRCGEERARRVTQARLPMGTAEAKRLGLIDDHFGASTESFIAEVERRVSALAADPRLDEWIAAKQSRRAADEAARPLTTYRHDELEHMRLNFYGFDPSYHVARYNFVRKIPKSRTPLFLASHRRVGRSA